MKITLKEQIFEELLSWFVQAQNINFIAVATPLFINDILDVQTLWGNRTLQDDIHTLQGNYKVKKKYN